MRRTTEAQTRTDDPIALLRAWDHYHGQVVCHRVIASHPATLAMLPAALDEAVRPVLPPGLTALFQHQATVLDHAVRGENLTLATPTASGKTLALALPGLLARQEDREARVLCVAPTRALVEQWQERLADWDPTGPVEAYTGDTPKAQRAAIRERARWLVTTPDMLHMGLLPYHMKWHPFLSRLRYVIVDESHVYRGVFGSHVTHVLRRLRRMARAHRAPALTFLFASATIGNPSDHAAALLGLPVLELTENGAPSGARTVVLWQPPDEAGHSEEAAALMAFFLSHGLRTILFGQARQSVERMLREVRGRVPAGLIDRVASYRAGYMAHERHAIHRRLAAGDLLGVVTTNALELGIDIGSLDVSILDGFPGSVASFWQQAGRAGRGQADALTVLVLRQDALDQYFAAHPEHLFARPVEHALVNPSNPTILPAHLLCAAYEKPLTPGECDLFGPAAQTVATTLVEQGRMLDLAGTYRARSGDNPAYSLSLRQAGERIAIVDVARGTVLEDTDVYHAVSECYPGAIYFSQGTMYIVRNQDMERGQIGVERCEVDYYTEPLEWKEVAILAEQDRMLLGATGLCVGQVRVTQHVTGFVRRHQQSRAVIGMESLESPHALPLETVGLWIAVAPAVVDDLVHAALDPAGSLHAAEHALIALLPLFVLGDRRDVGGVSILPEHHQTRRATIFVYDGYPGGIGYAVDAYRQFIALGSATHEAIAACPCEAGCYACVQSPKCGNQNRPLDKAGAVRLLAALLTCAGDTR